METPTLSSTTPTSAPALETPPPLQPHLLDRIVEGAHETIDRLAEHAAPHAQRIEEAASGANQLLQDKASQARDIGQEWTDGLRNTVREHPLVAVAAAVAAGMLIARLLRSER